MKLDLGKLASLLTGGTKRFAAVDLDRRELRIVLAERAARGVRIHSAVRLPLPEGVAADDPQAVGAFLGESLRRLQFRGGGIVMNVPRSQAVLKPLVLPPGTPPAEIAGMVHYQVGKELPFPAQDAVVDFTMESHYGAETERPGEQPEGVSVLVAAIRMSVVDQYRRIAEAAGVKLLRLALRPYANLRCVSLCDPRAAESLLALVHVTADETEIDVLSHGSLAFSRSALRSIEAGEGQLQPPDAAIRSLVLEVTRSLQSFQAAERHLGVERVLLAGGTGIEEKVAEHLSKGLGVPCGMLDVSAALASRQGKEIDSAFVSAVGLAAAHSATGEFPFDFLNPKRPAVRRDPRKQRVAAVAAAALLLLLAAVLGGWLYLHSKQNQIVAIQGRIGQLDKDILSVGERAGRVLAIEEWASADRNWLDHWAQLSVLSPSAQDVYLTGLRTNADDSVSFTVQARESEAVTSLGEELDEAGYEFKPGQIKTGGDPFGYTYGTTVRVLLPKEFQPNFATTRPVGRPDDDSSAEEFYRRAAAAGLLGDTRPSDQENGQEGDE